MQGEQLEKLFRSNMRNRRNELGLTQAEVSQLSGIPQPRVSALERGTMAPSITTIAKIAEALRCPPSALLSAESAELAGAKNS